LLRSLGRFPHSPHPRPSQLSLCTFIDSFNKGDAKAADATYAKGSIAIVDEFAPHLRIPRHRGHGFHGKVGMISTRRWARIPREGGRSV
jgi:hypothetical protein